MRIASLNLAFSLALHILICFAAFNQAVGESKCPNKFNFIEFPPPSVKKNSSIFRLSLVEIWHFSRLALILHNLNNSYYGYQKESTPFPP